VTTPKLLRSAGAVVAVFGLTGALIAGVGNGLRSNSDDVTVLLSELGSASSNPFDYPATPEVDEAEEAGGDEAGAPLTEHDSLEIGYDADVISAEEEARKRAEAEAARQAEEEAEAARQAEEEAARRAEEAAAQAEAEREAAAERESRSSTRESSTTSDASDPKAAARAMLSDYGWGDDQFSCLDNLWERESNWNHLARNPSSGAYGIPQSLPAEKMATAGDDWQTNPITQITWGLGYIDERYGSPCAAWSHSESVGWY
jgi:hypothetical protein